MSKAVQWKSMRKRIGADGLADALGPPEERLALMDEADIPRCCDHKVQQYGAILWRCEICHAIFKKDWIVDVDSDGNIEYIRRFHDKSN
jgi:hypothetical protein